MARSRVPKYRRHSTGQAFVEFNTKRYYLGPYGSPESKRAYAKFLADNIERPPSPTLTGPAPANLLIKELVAAYAEHAAKYYRKEEQPTSEFNGLKYAWRPLVALYGDTQASQFGPRALKAVREKMVAADLSRGTVNERISQIKRMFRWAGENEMLPAEVCHALQLVSGLKRGRSLAKESPPIGPVSDATVEATLPFLPPVVRDMVNFQRATGCRPGEVCTLRPCDIDRSDEVWVYRPPHHKTEHVGRVRLIFIGPRAQAALRAISSARRTTTASRRRKAKMSGPAGCDRTGEARRPGGRFDGLSAPARNANCYSRVITRRQPTTAPCAARSIGPTSSARENFSGSKSCSTSTKVAMVAIPARNRWSGGGRINSVTRRRRSCGATTESKQRASCWGTVRLLPPKFTRSVTSLRRVPRCERLVDIVSSSWRGRVTRSFNR